MLAQNSSSDDLPYIAPDIKVQLDRGREKVVDGDQDRLYAITGREGSGKSTLALQFAAYLDPSFCLDDIVFTPGAFEKRIREAKRYKCIVFDEAFVGMSSKAALSTENRRLTRLLMECRQRNLFIFIVMPSFFLLERYPAIFRSNALFNVLISKLDVKRRAYKVYNYQQKKLLYIYGKKFMDYSKPRVPLSHRFYSRFPSCIDKAEYDKKKLAAFRDTGEKMLSEKSMLFKQRNFMLYFLNKIEGYSYVEISAILEKGGCPLETTGIGRHIRGFIDKNEE